MAKIFHFAKPVDLDGVPFGDEFDTSYGRATIDGIEVADVEAGSKTVAGFVDAAQDEAYVQLAIGKYDEEDGCPYPDGIAFLRASEAIEIATALLNAAQQATYYEMFSDGDK